MKRVYVFIIFSGALFLFVLPCKVDIPWGITGAEKVHVAGYSPDHFFSAHVLALRGNSADAFDRKAGLDSQTHEIERLVYEGVNQERKKHRLKLLVRDPLLADTALLHSLDMAQRGYFSHTNERGEDPSTRAKKGGVSVAKRKGSLVKVGIGENIGMIPTGNVKGLGYISSPQEVAQAMMKTWLKSHHHRANILNADYEATGVGVAHDSDRTYYLTQDFR